MPKISRLEIKNCLGISELEIQAGKVNIIKGGNEKGKTSILEVIEKGLQNTQRRTKFVRDGAKEATLYIEMDDTTSIDRRIKPDGKTSSKITQHGASIPKPETYLKTIIGEGFGFNPIDFMGKKDKEQTEILLFESLDDDQRGIFFKEIEGDGYQYFISQVTNGDLTVEALEGGVV